MRALALLPLLVFLACGGVPVGPPPPPVNTGGVVGPKGGAVDKLHFAFTGDTRPSSCDQTGSYPRSVIEGIAGRIAARKAQFAMDLGDHMYVCSDGLGAAREQMGFYVAATEKFPSTWFMTMGNHECGSSICAPGSADPNYTAFMEAMKSLSALPYYSFDVTTGTGLARFVVIADNAWSVDQQTWLEQTLTEADAKARWTIVAQHHPLDYTSGSLPLIQPIVKAHKHALWLTGHSHKYLHSGADNGRTVVMGIGGAGTSGPYGYGVVDQQDDGSLKLTVLDSTSDNLIDAWSAGPN